MKEPRLKDLVYDKKGTKKIRRRATISGSKVKITLNIDKDVIEELKYVIDEAGASYQKLINRIIKEALVIRNDTVSRLAKLEKEVKLLKRRIA